MVDIIFYVVMTLLVVALVGCLVVLWRNDRVHKFEKALIDEVGRLNREEIRTGNLTTWGARWVVLDSVSYEKKLFSLKRLKASNFYDNLDFLNGKDVSLRG